MKKNIISRVLSLFLLTVTVLSLFTGCMRTGIGVVINPDDSGDVELSFGIEKNAYNSLTEEYGTDIFDGKETTELKDKDDTYICVVEHIPFNSLEELETILSELEYAGDEMNALFAEEDDGEPAEAVDESENRIFKSVEVEKKEHFFSTEYVIDLVTNSNVTEDKDSGLSLFGDETYKLLIAVTLPGEVTADDGAVIQGNSASWKIADFCEESALHAESRDVNTTRIVTTVVITVCVIILLGFLIRASKKKTNNNH